MACDGPKLVEVLLLLLMVKMVQWPRLSPAQHQDGSLSCQWHCHVGYPGV